MQLEFAWAGSALNTAQPLFQRSSTPEPPRSLSLPLPLSFVPLIAPPCLLQTHSACSCPAGLALSNETFGEWVERQGVPIYLAIEDYKYKATVTGADVGALPAAVVLNLARLYPSVIKVALYTLGGPPQGFPWFGCCHSLSRFVSKMPEAGQEAYARCMVHACRDGCLCHTQDSAFAVAVLEPTSVLRC